MKKFYQLTREERVRALVDSGMLSAADAELLLADTPLPQATADHLTENQIGQFPLPMGLVRGLRVNGITHDVALVGEEPSVVAAANNGARMALAGGGVTVQVPPHRVAAEVVFADLPDTPNAVRLIRAQTADIKAAAAAAHPSIVRRGGGLQTVTVTTVDDFVKVTLVVDPQQAMGANIVNTIAERVGVLIGGWLHQQPLISILSNYSDDAVVARVDLPVEAVATRHADGATVAKLIARTSDFALLDIDRATTNNKGVMNGIAAAAIALGNDYRAVEAGAHAYAARTGRYLPLTRWWVAESRLHGELAVPLQLGVVGGAVGALHRAGLAQRLAGIKTVADAQSILAALGLVQNLAAIRALVGPGIQAGHMHLQAGALAVAAGAVGDEVALLTQQLQDGDKTIARAQSLLHQMRQ